MLEDVAWFEHLADTVKQDYCRKYDMTLEDLNRVLKARKEQEPNNIILNGFNFKQ